MRSSTRPIARPAAIWSEIGRRLIAAQPDAEVLAIGNPLLPLNVRQLTGWLGAAASVPAIVTDGRKFPLLYILPRHLFDQFERFLLLLSTVDAVADERLLCLLAGQPVTRVRIPEYEIANFRRRRRPIGFKAKRASRCSRFWRWRRSRRSSAIPNGVPCLCHLPALSRRLPAVSQSGVATGRRQLFDKQIVCWSYKDIYLACPGRQQPLWLRLPWLPRDNSVGELEYLVRSLERLGEDVIDNHFIVFMRYSRIYSVPPFHLMDQLKFALGDSMSDESRTVHGRPPSSSARPTCRRDRSNCCSI